MAQKNPEETNVNPFPFADGIMNQAKEQDRELVRKLAHKLTHKLANAALFKAAGQTRFKAGAILPVYGR